MKGKTVKTKIVKLGEVGVDSGQLIICDPSYLGKEGQFLEPDSGDKNDHAHPIYKHSETGKLWQFCYGDKPSRKHVNGFPGTYGETIPEYGLTPNDLIENGKFIETAMDPVPHIPSGEFSYRGICKVTGRRPEQGGQLNYLKGHPGVAVAFSSGFGDGTYGVYAELIDTDWGERIKKVWIELINDKEIEKMHQLTQR